MIIKVVERKYKQHITNFSWLLGAPPTTTPAGPLFFFSSCLLIIIIIIIIMMMKNDHHCTSVAISKVFVIGLIWFFVLNAKLALHLFTTSHDAVHTRDSLPSTFLKHMWDSSSSSAVASSSSKTTTTTTSGCPTYGCPIFPEEYQSEIVQRALKQQEQNNNNDNNKGQDRRNTVPFASSTFAMLTRTSNRKVPPFNQDAGIAIIPYRTQQTTTSNNDFFIGIFDGHGAEGHITAQHFRTDIPQRLAERLNHLANNNNNNNNVVHSTSTSRMAEQIYQTFVEADNEAPIKIKLRGGCTGSVVIRQDDTLYFSNTGDSRSVLLVVNATDFQIVNEGPAPGVRELYSTRLDKANLPDEKQRIESMCKGVWGLYIYIYMYIYIHHRFLFFFLFCRMSVCERKRFQLK